MGVRSKGRKNRHNLGSLEELMRNQNLSHLYLHHYHYQYRHHKQFQCSHFRCRHFHCRHHRGYRRHLTFQLESKFLRFHQIRNRRQSSLILDVIACDSMLGVHNLMMIH